MSFLGWLATLGLVLYSIDQHSACTESHLVSQNDAYLVLILQYKDSINLRGKDNGRWDIRYKD